MEPRSVQEWNEKRENKILFPTIIIIIYIALFSYSFIALYNDQVNAEPKS